MSHAELRPDSGSQRPAALEARALRQRLGQMAHRIVRAVLIESQVAQSLQEPRVRGAIAHRVGVRPTCLTQATATKQSISRLH